MGDDAVPAVGSDALDAGGLKPSTVSRLARMLGRWVRAREIAAVRGAPPTTHQRIGRGLLGAERRLAIVWHEVLVGWLAARSVAPDRCSSYRLQRPPARARRLSSRCRIARARGRLSSCRRCGRSCSAAGTRARRHRDRCPRKPDPSAAAVGICSSEHAHQATHRSRRVLREISVAVREIAAEVASEEQQRDHGERERGPRLVVNAR